MRINSLANFIKNNIRLFGEKRLRFARILPEVLWLLLVVLSLYSVFPNSTLFGSRVLDGLLKLIGAVGVNALYRSVEKRYESWQQSLGDVKAKEIQNELEQVLQEILKTGEQDTNSKIQNILQNTTNIELFIESASKDVKQRILDISLRNNQVGWILEKYVQGQSEVRRRGRNQIGLVILALLTALLAMWQWSSSQQNAFQALQKADEAQQQARYAEEQTTQANRLSSANKEIIEVLLKDISEPTVQGEKFSEIGDVYQSRGLLEDALRAQERALYLYQQAKFLEGQGMILNKIGQIYAIQGDQNVSQNNYERALALLQTTNDHVGVGTTLNNNGTLYQNRGLYQRSLLEYQKAQAAFEQRQVDRDIARARFEDTSKEEDKITFEISQRAYEETEVNSSIGVGLVLNNIGSTYQHLGKFEEAADFYSRAFEIFDEKGAEIEKARTLRYIGSLHSDKDEYQESVQKYTQAQDIYQKENQLEEVGRTLTYLADLYLKKKDPEQALVFYNRALEIHTESGNPWDLGRIYSGIGDVFRVKGNYDEAIKNYEHALSKQKSINDHFGQASAHEGIGKVYEMLGNLDQAILEHKYAIDLLENVLSTISIEEFRTAFMDRHISSYEHLIQLLWDNGNFVEAFHLAELARSRTFLDQISGTNISFRDGGDQILLTEEGNLRNLIKTVRYGLKPQEQNNSLQVHWSEILESGYKQYEDLRFRLKLVSPNYQKQDIATPPTVDILQNEVLDRDVALIEYFLINERIFVWIIDRDTFNAVELTIPHDKLEEFTHTDRVTTTDLIEQLANVITTKEFDYNLSGFLYSYLFAPLQRYIRYNHIVIVPHASLHKLPFSALWDGQKQNFLVDKYDLSFVPSASTLKFLGNRQNSNNLDFLGLGIGRYSSSKSELQTISNFYAATPYIREDATESIVKRLAEQSDIIYLASDAVVNAEHPLFSYIELVPSEDTEDDGYLDIAEIYDLNLSQVNLIVLFGVKTSPQEISPSDETISFERAFLSSGSSAVISTDRQDIDGEASAALLELVFYYWVKEGKSISEALQSAQKDFLRKDQYRQWNNPYYWSVFNIYGDYQGGTN